MTALLIRLAAVPFVFGLLLPCRGMVDPNQVIAQQKVLASLMANASKKPPGPVENDLPSGVAKACEAFLRQKVGDTKTPLRDALASDYNFFKVTGPLTPIYANAKTALLSAPIKLNDATVHDSDLPLNPDCGPSFGANMGGSMYLRDKKINQDGSVVGTFCFILENSAWKIHNLYISNAALTVDDTKFIVRQLDEYAKTHQP